MGGGIVAAPLVEQLAETRIDEPAPMELAGTKTVGDTIASSTCTTATTWDSSDSSRAWPG